MQFDLHPFKSVDEARSWASTEIDSAAGVTRARYITVAQGQDATYQAKYADALAFSRAGYPEEASAQYPWVLKEAEAIRGTLKQAADGIRAVGDPWNMDIGPRIEGLRIGGKRALADQSSIGAVVAHTRKVQRELSLV